LRLVSLLAGLPLVPATYWCARRWGCSPAAGLLAATFVAVDRHALFFAQEARVYALVQLVSLARLAVFTSLLAHPSTGRRWGWVTLAALHFHLHYTTALLLPAEVVAYILWRWWARPAPQGRRYGAAAIALDVTVVLAVWSLAWPHLAEIAERRGNWARFVRQQPPQAMLTLFPLTAYVGIPLWALGLDRAVRRWRREVAPKPLPADTAGCQPAYQSGRLGGAPLAAAIAWFVVPLALAWILTQLDVARLFFRRYVLAASVVLPLWSAMMVTPIARRGLLLVTCLAGCLLIGPFGRLPAGLPLLVHSREDWRGAVARINRDGEAVPVLVGSRLIEADRWHDAPEPRLREFCLLPVRGLYRLEPRFHHVVPLPYAAPVQLAPDLVSRVAEQGGLWLLERGTGPTVDRVRQQLLQQLRASGLAVNVAVREEYGRVTLLRLAVDADAGRSATTIDGNTRSRVL
jgi:hypothetical protein